MAMHMHMHMHRSTTSTNSSSGKKNKKSILRLKIVVEKLQKGLLLGKIKMAAGSRDHHHVDLEQDNNMMMMIKEEEDTNNYHVPEDVKEGHLAVVANSSVHDEQKRFIVPLGFLTHPSFITLLEQAAEVYGFDHQGALMVPCHPNELDKILKRLNNTTTNSEVSGSNLVDVGWPAGCSKSTLVKTY